ncbi:hypothetical protein QBC34DRAFT_498102 [Podospora aff. communis PSN243]|uniref:Granulins domain-containing protein n=1 Tax=Podospora aff. communis PSN243 TaxID=3040156 RepID=A0AAV9GBR7_9PEZI|nr:hypothetical protein QBC34DRAFT_498102 [Podospora aff. communis PSN243]
MHTTTPLLLLLTSLLPTTLATTNPSLPIRSLTHPNPLLLLPRQSCLSSERSCGTSCIPSSASCCSASEGTFCPSGYRCDGDGCCENGEICSGPGLGCPRGSERGFRGKWFRGKWDEYDFDEDQDDGDGDGYDDDGEGEFEYECCGGGDGEAGDGLCHAEQPHGTLP